MAMAAAVPTFALVFFRLAGMMLAAPLFGKQGVVGMLMGDQDGRQAGDALESVHLRVDDFRVLQAGSPGRGRIACPG